METYWMVHNPERGYPTCKHYSLCSAKAEAERLSRNNPGEDFVVLQSIAKVKVDIPAQWEETAIIPF